MQITEVQIQLADGEPNRRHQLKAYCSVVFDDQFAVRDLRIIEGPMGMFVSMPSRKLHDHCHECEGKTALQDRFCAHCGTRLKANRARLDGRGRPRLYADNAHPINRRFRGTLERAVLAEYRREVERSEMLGRAEAFEWLDIEDMSPVEMRQSA